MTNLCVYVGLLVTALVAATEAHLNLFLNVIEVQRLLGLSAEIYYVREGQVNAYALHFTVPVPADVEEISFTWQSLADRPLPYRINIDSPDSIALPKPSMNISWQGEIPEHIETFAIGLRCSGQKSAEVDVTITIEVTLDRMTGNTTELLFRRKKICLMSEHPDATQPDPYLLENASNGQNGLITIIIGGILAILFVSIFIMIAYCVRGSFNRKPHHAQPIRTSSFQRLQTHAPSAPSSIVSPPSIAPTIATLSRNRIYANAEPEELQRRISELTVQRCRVRLSSLLQEGTFGRVYRGSYNDSQEVLVKTVGPHASQVQVSLLLHEGMSLYGAQHPGILSVLGVSIDDHTAPFLLYLAPENTRNLKIFLQEPVARTLTTIQIVKIQLQLAQALGHLHSHGVIHKDIAARNCVIDDQLRVKLADNSLSRDLFPGDYYCLGDSENRPIKWLALESIQFKQFSEASDTWAFGVLMWELCTLARQPYAEVDPFEMEHYLRDGYRLSQPINCPDELFAIMAYCWTMLPMERPSFEQLQICLQDFYAQLTRYV
ncbi:tyrosine-protein kinase Dnt [Anopheles maculipalpis]|uniref:tyrosine-protein kinase Dnt n=1 Tax=Anopheles maculipalpis TaxID=1496333 RepID=UPI002158D821|nr:tyrosine-protein kinase Dnt [Anopheles maculipalpis]